MFGEDSSLIFRLKFVDYKLGKNLNFDSIYNIIEELS